MRFSIIVPTYNRAHLIGETLKSLLEQTYEDFEILVIDDGSTDNTGQIISSFNSSKIKFVKLKHGGVSNARNYGLSIAEGEFVNFFDSDDIAYSNHLKLADEFLKKKADAKFLSMNYDWRSVKGINKRSTLNYSEPNLEICKRNFLSTNGVFIEKGLCKSVGFNSELTISEDWLLWIELACLTQLYLLPHVTTCIIEHSERTVSNQSTGILLRQKKIFLNALLANNIFIQKNRKYLHIIDAHMRSYIAIHGASKGEKKIPILLFFSSICRNPASSFNKRSLAILKHLFLTW